MRKYKAIIYDIDGTILNTLNVNYPPSKDGWACNWLLQYQQCRSCKNRATGL